MIIDHARSRTHVARDHALVTPESHVWAPLPGWTAARSVTLFAPVMGAGFVQHLVAMDAGAKSAPPLAGFERFVYVLEGEVTLLTDADHELSAGGYALLPADAPHAITAERGARLLMLEKRYAALDGHAPRAIVGHEHEVEGVPFLGDPTAVLRSLIPDELGFDLAMNTFEFQPGAMLPMVESHVMEHGLWFLTGGGVYRLGDAWYPVGEGDAIWMAPYLPQWFGCLGKTPAKYLYYKDVNRDPALAPRR